MTTKKKLLICPFSSPIYNWDVRKLLLELQRQIDTLQDTFCIEIIAVDDGSLDKFDVHEVMEKLPSLRYRELDENLGRGKVRNLLLTMAKGEYLLFLDADVFPDNDTFLQRYLAEALKGHDIVCGGRSYTTQIKKGKLYSFYLYKSNRTEVVDANKRNVTPWRYFFTSNVFIRRTIVEKVQFSERFSGYGYEDIEWAIRLGKSYSLLHIDNPCSHLGVVTKIQAFQKMRISVKNYALMLALHPDETKNSSAAIFSSFLCNFPDFFLTGCDVVLKRLFKSISWNPLLFFIFQVDKMVLLAQEIKRPE